MRLLDGAARASDLPEQFTSFVGRERELAELASALDASRLLVLTGTGGCGKTRLALELAAERGSWTPGGAWWVALESIRDGELVGAALAGVLGIRAAAGRTPLQAAVDHLAQAQALVVLDNCEHVAEQAHEVCEALLRGCPGVQVLATSRSVLGVAGEVAWPVPPLSLPTAGPASDAVALFVERARAARPGFRLSSENVGALERICLDLDGIPLAIELAAARVRVLSPAQIVAALEDRFRLLTRADPIATPRQQTLRGSVDWSYELLTIEERMLFRRLAVFAGSCSLAAVEGVCIGDDLASEQILDLLSSLVEQSLVVAEERGGEVRFRMLVTLREYGLELLRDHRELRAVRDRHLAFFLAMAQEAAPQLVTVDHREWLEQLEPEDANLAAAIQHGIEVAPEAAQSLCAALTWWWLRGRFAAGQLACTRALAAGDPAPSRLRGRVMWCRAFVARHAGEYASSYALAGDALAIAEAVGDRETVGRALWSIGAIQLYPDPVGCRDSLRRAHELAREVGDEWTVAHATSTLAYSYLFTDEIDEADRLFHEALPAAERIGTESLTWIWLGFAWGPTFRVQPEPCFRYGELAAAAARDFGDPVPEAFAQRFMAAIDTAQGRPAAALERLERGEARAIASQAGMALPPLRIERAIALNAVGELARAGEILQDVVAEGADGGYNLADALNALAGILGIEGRAQEAADLARRALEIGTRIGSRSLTSGSRRVLGRLAAARGEWAEAEASLQAALAERAEPDLRIFLPQSLEDLALVAAGLGAGEEAARLLGAATRGRRDLGLVRGAPEQTAFTGLQERLTRELGPGPYEAAYADGGRMPLAEAIARVRRTRGPRRRPSTGWESLTPTEQRVVALVSEGLTNPQIAERMVISRATVKVHLAHVFRKLDVSTRAQLSAEAVRRQM